MVVARTCIRVCWIPKSPDHVYPITEIVPIQLLSYYSALSRGTDPDYPRNLAKSYGQII